MGLPVGSRLGPYEILALVGTGGMGEVYQARDPRLGRDVAIKVLPSAFTADPDRLRRFEQEARAAAALNHPNILTVYEVGTHDGQPYVVAELLEGHSVREVLGDGALPVRQTINWAIQICQGLAAAHEKGIVHRDVKPENLFVTKDDRLRILDFGLAKLTQTAFPVGATIMATHAPDTSPGVVLGTVGYMSPEQVRGEPSDHLTDIFAFGAVLYEMLSGRSAFNRETPAETMTAVLKEDPLDLTSGFHRIPSALERIVRRCLEKNPRQRFQSASDVAFALEPVTASTVSSDADMRFTLERRSWRQAAIVVAAIAVAVTAAFALGVASALRSAEARHPVPLFHAKTFDPQEIFNARFMPDDQTVVYSAASHGLEPELFVIRPDSDAPQSLRIPDTHLLSVSSKGELAVITKAEFIGQRLFTGTLARMTIGSAPRPMLEHVREADWGPDGLSLAVIHDLLNGRDRLEYPAGTSLYEVSGYLSDLRVSPDGLRVAFFEHQWRWDDRGWVKVVDRAGHVTTLAGEFKALEGLAWKPDNATVVFSAPGTERGFGGTQLQVKASSITGRPNVWAMFGTPGRFVVFDAARDGRWLAMREDQRNGVRARVPGQSTERDLSWLGSSQAAALSSDGQSLLLTYFGEEPYAALLRKTDGSPPLRLGEGEAEKLSPDGKWAAAVIATPPQLVLYPTGPGEPIRLNRGPIERYMSGAAGYPSVQWFPDSRRVLVCGSEPARPPRCYVQDLAGSLPKTVTPEGVVGSLAPDGRTILLSMADGTRRLSSVDGGPSRPVASLRPQDQDVIVGWSGDSSAVFVQRGISAMPVQIERVDVMSGERRVVRVLAPADLRDSAGASAWVVDWIDNGRGYAYSYTQVASTLFIVKDVKP